MIPAGGDMKQGDNFSQHTANIALWGGFGSVSLLIYFFFSSGDFSFLLTYASFMRFFGLALLNYSIWMNRTVKGISLKTLQAYAVVFVARLLSILRHQGYLPFDKTGDWFYHFVEIMSFFIVIIAMYGVYAPFMSTYDERHDKFGNLKVPNEYGIVYLIAPAVVLAVLFHPSLNHEFFSDSMWALSMYLEAVAMLPQLYMFQKLASSQGAKVEALVGHTVFALSFSRVFELVFWMYSFRELANHAGSRMSGYLVLITQVGQLLIMGDFFYYYFKSLSKGMPMDLPASGGTAEV